MSSQANLYSSTLADKKAFLAKYCYFNSKDISKYLKVTTEQMLLDCTNEYAIEFIHKFFIEFILPYYTINRTKFNKLRSCFMRQVLITLIALVDERLVTSDYYIYYDYWIDKCKISECKACMHQMEVLKPKFDYCKNFSIS